MTEPRLMNRKEAARYMCRCVKTFDRIKHLFQVEDDGFIRYDRVLMDRYIALHSVAA